MSQTTKATWKEFRESGLLWWVNRSLHLFGWAIALDLIDGEVISVYPVRTKFRGFEYESEEKGFLTLTKHMKSNVDQLLLDQEKEEKE